MHTSESVQSMEDDDRPPVAIGARLAEKACCPRDEHKRLQAYRFVVLLLTFLSYTCYHIARKPISVVKTKLLNCTDPTNCTSFISEMNGLSLSDAKRLEGSLDSSLLFAYAISMFISGIVAERVNLRYFLSLGMLLSGIFTAAFGFGYYMGIHSIAYYIFMQIGSGACLSSGWPGVVTVVANWFGKGKKGLIFGVWNSHTSIGNILGSLLAGAFVEDSWGLSFIVPGISIASVGIVMWLMLVPRPEDVDLEANEDSAQENSLLAETASHPSVGGQGEFSPLLQSDEEEELDPGRPSTRTLHPEADAVQRRTHSPSPDTEHRAPSREPQDHAVEQAHHHHHYHHEAKAITFLGALKIPGVVEFALCLFFAKLVSYVFLFWLPTFIIETGINISSEDAAYLSTLFDIGGIVGGILAGVISDYTGRSASTCAVMLIAAIPMLFAYETFGHQCPLDMTARDQCYSGNIGLLLVVGLFVNGPYALITTAVSAELGTHPSLHGCAKALATVTSIIDGMGSIGAAIGPFLAGAITNLDNVFYMLMAADVCALLFLLRLVKRDFGFCIEAHQQNRRSNLYQRQN